MVGNMSDMKSWSKTHTQTQPAGDQHSNPNKDNIGDAIAPMSFPGLMKRISHARQNGLRQTPPAAGQKYPAPFGLMRVLLNVEMSS